jgi:Ring hydroxylating alpha subunit (catalytic domain)
MPTYKVIQRSDHHCRHFAEIKPPTLPDDTTTPPPSPSGNSGWFGFLPSLGISQTTHTSPSPPVNRGGDTDGLWLYLFPNIGVNCYSPAFYTQRVVPKSANRTLLEYDIYNRKGAHPSEIKNFIEFLKEVEQEDFDLCEATQKNLNSGVYMSGPLHPVKENGVLCESIIIDNLCLYTDLGTVYQVKTKEMIMEHLKLEKEAGKEIHPAFAGLKYAGEKGKEADALCKSLDCLAGEGINADQFEW